MPVTVYTPTIERKVIIDHSKPMIDITLDDLRVIQQRWANVGEKLEALREAPARYSALRHPIGDVMFDLSQFLTLTVRALDIMAADIQDHQHEFITAVRSGPRTR